MIKPTVENHLRLAAALAVIHEKASGVPAELTFCQWIVEMTPSARPTAEYFKDRVATMIRPEFAPALVAYSANRNEEGFLALLNQIGTLIRANQEYIQEVFWAYDRPGHQEYLRWARSYRN